MRTYRIGLMLLVFAIAALSPALADICTSQCNQTACALCAGQSMCDSGCSSAPCNKIGDFCNCVATCNTSTSTVSTSCSCKNIFKQPSGTSALFVMARDVETGFTLGAPVGTDPITLVGFGAALEESTGWAVFLTGDTTTTITTGSWSGTLTDILDDIGLASGFTVAWDDNNDSVTLHGI